MRYDVDRKKVKKRKGVGVKKTRRITFGASNECYIRERNDLSTEIKGIIRFLDCNAANPYVKLVTSHGRSRSRYFSQRNDKQCVSLAPRKEIVFDNLFKIVNINKKCYLKGANRS